MGGVASVSNLFQSYIYKSLQSLELDQNRKKVVFGWDRNVLVQILVDNRAVSVGEGNGGAVKGVRRRLVGRINLTRRKGGFFFFLSRRIIWLESEGGGGEKDGQ